MWKLPKRINFGAKQRVNPSFMWIMRWFFSFSNAIKPIFVVNENAFEVKYGVKSVDAEKERSFVVLYCSSMHFWSTTTHTHTDTNTTIISRYSFRNHKNRLISLRSALYVEPIEKLNNWNHLKNAPSAFSLHLKKAFNFFFSLVYVCCSCNASNKCCDNHLCYKFTVWNFCIKANAN